MSKQPVATTVYDALVSKGTRAAGCTCTVIEPHTCDLHPSATTCQDCPPVEGEPVTVQGGLAGWKAHRLVIHKRPD